MECLASDFLSMIELGQIDQILGLDIFRNMFRLLFKNINRFYLKAHSKNLQHLGLLSFQKGSISIHQLLL